MDKLKLHSPNIVDENVEKIGKLFPNCLTEHVVGYEKDEAGQDIIEKPIIERAIDFDILKQELSSGVVDGNEERYQFTWPDKKKSILLANAPIAKTLRPNRDESVDFDNTENLYVEGDNLDVLKLLQETYLGKVKMIYIDPPYNTGNDFVYEDDFAQNVDEYIENSGQFSDEGNRLVKNLDSNGRFHTDWLNMIYPRLKLAKDLLSDDGVLLINMDENEIKNLQKVCEDVFAEQNDLGTIVWDKRNPKGDAKGISSQHEYILVYAKSKYDFLMNNKVQRPKKNASKMIAMAQFLFGKINEAYTLDDANTEFKEWLSKQSDLSGGEKAYNRIDGSGELYQAVSMSWPNKKKAPDDYFMTLIHPITGKACPTPPRGWRNPSSTMKYLLKNNLIIFGEDETTQPRSKYLLSENMCENIPSLLYFGGSDTLLLNDIGIPFDTPKVTDICKDHILSFTSNADIILDFFAGSSTVAHGVMLANAEDGGNRKHIMVQLPEETEEKSEAYKAGYKNICEIGKERIRRAGKKIIEDNKDKKDIEKLDIGFRVFKLDSTNMKDVYYNPADYEADLLDSLAENIKEDRSAEDLLFQVMLDLGVLLSSKIEERMIADKKVFNVAEGFLLACFDEDVNEETIKAIAKKKPYYFVMRDSSISDDSVAANFEQIFATYSPDTVRKVL